MPQIKDEELNKIATNGEDKVRKAVDHKTEAFEQELRKLINSHGIDALFGIHDFVLSGFMVSLAKTLSVTIDAESSLRAYKKL